MCLESAVKEHLNICGQSYTLNDKEYHWYHRKIEESIMIQRPPPPLNHDQGLDSLVSHMTSQPRNNATEEDSVRLSKIMATFFLSVPEGKFIIIFEILFFISGFSHWSSV